MAPGSGVIEVHVAELRQLFNSIDPSPFRERDLDPRAEAFIVDWARELPHDAPLALLVHLERACGPGDEAAMLADAIHEYFAQRALGSRRRLRELFRRGRISLAIAVVFLGRGAGAATSSAVSASVASRRCSAKGLLIGGWVAMWRPLEVFLYDWWPIRAEARLSERLSTMPVSIEHEPGHPATPGGPIGRRSHRPIGRSRRVDRSSAELNHVGERLMESVAPTPGGFSSTTLASVDRRRPCSLAPQRIDRIDLTARRTGTRFAITAARASVPTPAASEPGSAEPGRRAFPPARGRPPAPSDPRREPGDAGDSAVAQDEPDHLEARAPNADRMPISCVRDAHGGADTA